MQTQTTPLFRSSIMLGEPSALRAPARPGHEERLPFVVRLVRTEEDMAKAVRVRQLAYARHMPAVAEKLHTPEATDLQQGVAVLLAESKVDGSPLGTARIQTNRHAPLALEEAIELPDWLQGKSLAHVSRLGVVQGGIGRLVKLMLFKGLYQYWLDNHIDWAVVAARTPLDTMYQQLLFQDMFPQQPCVPLAHMGNVPHRVMAFEVATANERWTRAQHPLRNFMVLTRHVDLDVRDTQTRRAAARHTARESEPLGYAA
jgi:hypothetical protein